MVTAFEKFRQRCHDLRKFEAMFYPGYLKPKIWLTYAEWMELRQDPAFAMTWGLDPDILDNKAEFLYMGITVYRAFRSEPS